MNQTTYTPITGLEIYQHSGFTAITCTPAHKIRTEYAGCRVTPKTLHDGRELTIYEFVNGWQIVATDAVHGLTESVERRHEAYGEIYFHIFDRDTEGNLTGITHSHSKPVVYLAGDKHYGLSYRGGRYYAGCRDFTYEEAISHWSSRLEVYEEIYREASKIPDHAGMAHQAQITIARATKFLAAIEAHQKTLRSIEDACKYI